MKTKKNKRIIFAKSQIKKTKSFLYIYSYCCSKGPNYYRDILSSAMLPPPPLYDMDKKVLSVPSLHVPIILTLGNYLFEVHQ